MDKVKELVTPAASASSSGEDKSPVGNLVIYKHTLSIGGGDIGRSQTIQAPKGSFPLSVANQNGSLVLWTAHEAKNASELEPLDVIVAWTGPGNQFELPKGYRFFGTVQIQDLVYHVFVA